MKIVFYWLCKDYNISFHQFQVKKLKIFRKWNILSMYYHVLIMCVATCVCFGFLSYTQMISYRLTHREISINDLYLFNNIFSLFNSHLFSFLSIFAQHWTNRKWLILLAFISNLKFRIFFVTWLLKYEFLSQMTSDQIQIKYMYVEVEKRLITGVEKSSPIRQHILAVATWK